jgi:hypothetical protein
MHKSLGKVNVIKHAMFDCEICLFRCPAAAGFSFNNCLAKHTFCRDCLKSNASVQIESNAVFVQCPGLRCLSKAFDSEIVPLVTKTEFAKLTLSRDKLDPSYRECGSCKQRMRFEGRSKLTCACGITSCFLHGTAHLMSESCEAFVHRTEQEEAATANTIRTTTKKCPKCDVNTEKNGGCGHIVSLLLILSKFLF